MRLILAFAVASLAACVQTATAADWYAGLYGGVNWNSVIDAPFVEAKDGAVIGGTVGRALAVPGLRIEADVSYRTNDVDVFGGFITAKHETTALLMNVVYDIRTGGDVKPYVLIGAGYAHTEATFESISLLKLEAGDLAFQAGAGAQVQVFPGARFGVGYRFFQGPSIDVLGIELSDGQNHSVVAGLSFDL